MDTLLQTAKRQWQDTANLLLGVWLIASPWALGFTDIPYALWNAYGLGAIVAVAAAAALLAFHEWEEWVSMVLGVWLVISPWILGFAATAFAAEVATVYAATWNFVFAGALVIGLASWATWDAHHRPGQAAT